VHREFLITLYIISSTCSHVDSASDRNEYQEYSLEGKGCQGVGLTALPPLCANCLENWDYNLLEAPGPVQGVDLSVDIAHRALELQIHAGRLYELL
jgi:hypothetical protein